MDNTSNKDNNVQQSVPFFAVSDMKFSIHFYVDGLGFEITQKWIDDGKLRWCWLQRGGAVLMLQEFRRDGHDAWIPECKVGEGVSIYFICEDALAIYREVTARGVEVSNPFVGNSMWTTGLRDPDGYQLYFESHTDVPEGTEYTDDVG
jgi:lactoylglutathione lyase